MSESDYPNRPLEGKEYSPIYKYGQISIAEQLARLEEIRSGGRRPSYRPGVPSQESQWGQIQEGFSQVESELSWQLRQASVANERKVQRRLSPDQDGRSWVQEYREKQHMRKVAQEAREKAEADLQRLLKEREEAQARAREQERLAAEAAERLRKIEDAEQEALRSAAREQQRREQRVLNAQVAEEKSEAEKMAELLASFHNLATAAQQPAEPTTSPADSLSRATLSSPMASQPVLQEPSASMPSAVQPIASGQIPQVAPGSQLKAGSAPVQLGVQAAPAPSRIFADDSGYVGTHDDSRPLVTKSFAGDKSVVGQALDVDTTQPVEVSPIDALADKADDRALADSLAFAAGSKNLAATRPAPVQAPEAPAHSSANTVATSIPETSAARGQAAYARSQIAPSPVTPAPQIQPTTTGNINTQVSPESLAPASASVDANNLSPVKLTAAAAGSAAELFQQALAQTKLNAARGVAPAPRTSVSLESNFNPAVLRPAPAPPVNASRQSQLTAYPTAAPQVNPQVSPVQAAPAPSVPTQVNVAASQLPLVQATVTAPSQPAPGSVQVPPVSQATVSLQPSQVTPSAVNNNPVGTLNPQVTPAPQAVPVSSGGQEAVAAMPATPTTSPMTSSVPAERPAPTPALSAEEIPSEDPAISSESEPPQEGKSRWWQWKRQTKKAEAPEQEDTRAGAWQEAAEDEDEEPLTFIQTFLRWVLRLSILLIIALGMVLTMDRPVISQTMGQDILQPGIVDNVSVTQI